MAVFRYRAKKNSQEFEEGEIEADTLSGAAFRLSDMGLYPLHIIESGAESVSDEKKIKLSVSWILFFTKEISDMLGSGLSLAESLRLICIQPLPGNVKQLTKKILEKVTEGEAFHAALSRFPGVFTPLYVNIVRSGEISGTLDTVMKRLVSYYEKSQGFRSKMTEALAYPVFLIFMGFLAAGVLTFFVIPKLVPMFDDIGSKLPLITEIVVSISAFMTEFWKILVLVVIFTVFVYLRLLKSRAFMQKCQELLFKLPFAGEFIKNFYLSQIFQSLESLTGNSVPVLNAVEITRDSVSFPPIRENLSKITDRIRNGESLSMGIRNSPFFSPKVYAVLRVGEETGKLHETMVKLSENYTELFDRQTRILTRFSGPVFIILIAVFVGVIVVAMLLPILNLNIEL